MTLCFEYFLCETSLNMYFVEPEPILFSLLTSTRRRHQHRLLQAWTKDSSDTATLHISELEGPYQSPKNNQKPPLIQTPFI